MQKILSAGLIMLVLGGCALTLQAEGHRVGGGLRYDVATDDTDGGYGVYAQYLYDISPLFSVQAGAGYLTGDYDLIDSVGLDGSYDAWILELALMAQFANDMVTPYAGMGAEMYYLEFDDMNASDKLGMFYTGGVRIPLGDRLEVDLNARYRHLQPKSYNPPIEEIRLDGFLFRVGLLWEL